MRRNPATRRQRVREGDSDSEMEMERAGAWRKSSCRETEGRELCCAGEERERGRGSEGEKAAAPSGLGFLIFSLFIFF